jgi:hypothetical protein
MDNKKFPSFFLAGAQKCATTWLYQCLKEHPQIFVPNQNITNFFNINYYRGFDWYYEWYKDVTDEKAIFDTSMTYMRDSFVPERIYRFNSNAKFIFSLRNPIDRAFSHYWHEKKKGKISFSFEDALFYSQVGNYDLYENWIKGGFYYEHIQRFLKYFPLSQMLFIFFEDIKNNPVQVNKDIYRFANVDTSFKPSIIDKKVNVAGQKNTNKGIQKKIKNFILKNLPNELKIKLKKNLKRKKNKYSEYDKGLDINTRNILQKIYYTENKKLEELLNLKLKDWK